MTKQRNRPVGSMRDACTHNDIMQAVVTALMFGEDAGIAALCKGNGGETLFLGAARSVHLSHDAITLLAEAQSMISRGVLPQDGMLAARYDIASACDR